MLQGKRTYICLAIAGAAYLANHFYPQYVSNDMATTIMGLFGIGSVAALRAAIVNAIAEAAAMCPPPPVGMNDTSQDQFKQAVDKVPTVSGDAPK